MARRQGLMFQNTPSMLDKALYQQRSTTSGAGLFTKGSNTKQKGPKPSGLSNIATGLSLANSAYKLYDKTDAGEKIGQLYDKIFGPAEAVSAAEGGVAGSTAGAEAVSAAAAPVAAEVAGSTAAATTAGATAVETMPAMSAAWGGVAGSTAGAEAVSAAAAPVGTAVAEGATAAANYLWLALL